MRNLLARTLERHIVPKPVDDYALPIVKFFLAEFDLLLRSGTAKIKLIQPHRIGVRIRAPKRLGEL